MGLEDWTIWAFGAGAGAWFINLIDYVGQWRAERARKRDFEAYTALSNKLFDELQQVKEGVRDDGEH